jgi:hypothetical protein
MLQLLGGNRNFMPPFIRAISWDKEPVPLSLFNYLPSGGRPLLVVLLANDFLSLADQTELKF